MKALETQQMKTATEDEDKERMEIFDGGWRRKQQSSISHCEGKPTTHSSHSALLAGTIGTVKKILSKDLWWRWGRC